MWEEKSLANEGTKIAELKFAKTRARTGARSAAWFLKFLSYIDKSLL